MQDKNTKGLDIYRSEWKMNIKKPLKNICGPSGPNKQTQGIISKFQWTMTQPWMRIYYNHYKEQGRNNKE